MESYHKVIEHILKNPNTLIRVACLKEDPEVILGYLIGTKDQTVAHWVFCKKSWRNIGIMKSLLTTETTATHATKAGLAIIKKKSLVFNPFIV